MSAEVFYIMQGDRYPHYRARAKDAEGNYIDLTSGDIDTLTFKLAPKNNHGSVKVSAAATVGYTANDGTVYDGSEGHFEYAWAADDTNTAGEFDAQLVIAYTDGKTLTCPSGGYKRVVIGDDL